MRLNRQFLPAFLTLILLDWIDARTPPAVINILFSLKFSVKVYTVFNCNDVNLVKISLYFQEEFLCNSVHSSNIYFLYHFAGPGGR